MKVKYLNGERHGKGKEYDEDGQLIYEEEFENGISKGQTKITIG